MKNIIIQYIRKTLLAGKSNIEVSETEDLLGSGLIDSMGIMKLINFIESEFEVKVPPEDMTIENFMTVQDIEGYLQKRSESA